MRPFKKKSRSPACKGTGGDHAGRRGLAACLDEAGDHKTTQTQNQTRADVNGVVGYERGDSIHNVGKGKCSGEVLLSSKFEC